jgi:hypothetical protein
MTTQFAQRARRRTTSVATIRRWCSTDGRLAIDEVTSTLGLSRRYLLVRILPTGEYVLSRHRRRTAAVRQAQSTTTQGATK